VAAPADTVAFVIGLGSECGCLCRHTIAMTGRRYKGLPAAEDCALSVTELAQTWELPVIP